MSFSKKLLVISGSFVLTACASMLNGKYQPVTVVPVGGDFETDQCVLKNDQGEWQSISGRETIVRRDYDALEVSCQGQGREGYAKVESKTQWRYYWANFFIWDLCLISCVIDMSTGAFYDYPRVIQVPMKPVPGSVVAAEQPEPVVRQPIQMVDASAQPVRTKQSVAPVLAPSGAAKSVVAESGSVALASPGESDWQGRAESMAAARDCVDLAVETRGESGAMYSMLCRTGREMLMCTAVGCRVMD